MIGTGYPVSLGWHAMRDFISGPQQQRVTVTEVNQIHMTYKFRDVPTEILEVTLADGRTFNANATQVAIEPGPAVISVLQHSGVILEVR